jgi:DNA-binding transcriptional regulator YhcF (GntR family)
VTLIRIDPDNPLAPYEQLRSQIAAMVASGDLEPGQKLQTVRQLASDLGLAANTVARAYRELEADGVISTQGRRGTFVHSLRLDENAAPPAPDAERAASVFAATARRMGLSLPEATRLVESAWPRPSG